MYGKIYCACVLGIDGKLIEVEVDVSNGLPQVNVVGLPDSAVRESIERVRSAIKNCKFNFPMERVTVNLAPADVRKEGSSFDLAIAIGILLASGQIQKSALDKMLIIGELALNGHIRPVPGVLSMVDQALKHGLTRVLLPDENAEEASMIPGIELLPIKQLDDVMNLDQLSLNPINHSHNKVTIDERNVSSKLDYSDVYGQHQAKRALMIAAAGLHNIIFIGPPGSGKTMLIRRLPSILPELTDSEALEVTKIYSVSGKLKDRPKLIRERPFRSPHHTISTGGLIGGGSSPKPGEVTMAHRGVLFLDELPEFTRNSLEVLRQPLEDRHVIIGRAKAVVEFPADFMLAASMNPCPCGYLGAETASQHCTCSSGRIQQYRAKISGPLLDRIDLHIEVPRIVEVNRLQSGLSSAEMKEAVLNAQVRQQKRYAGSGIVFNSELFGRFLREHCALTQEGERLMEQSFEALQLSLRSYDRILRIARCRSQ